MRLKSLTDKTYGVRFSEFTGNPYGSGWVHVLRSERPRLLSLKEASGSESVFRGERPLAVGRKSMHRPIEGASVMRDEQRRWRPPVQFYQRGESAREALKTLLAKSARTLRGGAARPVEGGGARPPAGGWFRRTGVARSSQ